MLADAPRVDQSLPSIHRHEGECPLSGRHITRTDDCFGAVAAGCSLRNRPFSGPNERDQALASAPARVVPPPWRQGSPAEKSRPPGGNQKVTGSKRPEGCVTFA